MKQQVPPRCSPPRRGGEQIPFARPWITDVERDAVLGVLKGHILTHGPQCKAFEAEFAAFLGVPASGGAAHCVSTSSCMAALHLAYLHFGLGPGDEVIVPAQTHTATAHAVEWVRARPVFADCDPKTGNLTAKRVEAALTSKTKAISVVHFLGIPCDMPAIMEVARRRRLWVVEDCALAVGSRFDGVHAGLFGDAGCFSFYPVKHITTGEGGMFVSRHEGVAQAVSRLRAFGVDRTHAERSVPGMYDVPGLGLNYRLSELQAALGRAQLGRVTENLDRRRKNFAVLKAGLSKVKDVRVLDSHDARAKNSHYCLEVVLEGPLSKRRGEIVAALNARGVGTSIYYPQPVPRMAYYRKKYGYSPGSFQHAEKISDCGIALPVGPHIETGDMPRIVDEFKAAVKEAS
ncbi:MAG: DegT/DnrJ/EryC1/StrS family aminotransferase [Elusimicrobia bacterium]|nr:DegT/DnrJ/EryC1/StrS family aminotransferase [Elusimicrobiota bacterium]